MFKKPQSYFCRNGFNFWILLFFRDLSFSIALFSSENSSDWIIWTILKNAISRSSTSMNEIWTFLLLLTLWILQFLTNCKIYATILITLFTDDFLIISSLISFYIFSISNTASTVFFFSSNSLNDEIQNSDFWVIHWQFFLRNFGPVNQIDDLILSILQPRDTISAGFCTEGTYLQIASDVFSCISDTRLITNVCKADGWVFNQWRTISESVQKFILSI